VKFAYNHIDRYHSSAILGPFKDQANAKAAQDIIKQGGSTYYSHLKNRGKAIALQTDLKLEEQIRSIFTASPMNFQWLQEPKQFHITIKNKPIIITILAEKVISSSHMSQARFRKYNEIVDSAHVQGTQGSEFINYIHAHEAIFRMNNGVNNKLKTIHHDKFTHGFQYEWQVKTGYCLNVCVIDTENRSSRFKEKSERYSDLKQQYELLSQGKYQQVLIKHISLGLFGITSDLLTHHSDEIKELYTKHHDLQRVNSVDQVLRFIYDIDHTDHAGVEVCILNSMKENWFKNYTAAHVTIMLDQPSDTLQCCKQVSSSITITSLDPNEQDAQQKITLESVQGLPKNYSNTVMVNGLNVNGLQGLPTGVTEIIFGGCDIRDLQHIPKHVQSNLRLKFNGCNMRSLLSLTKVHELVFANSNTEKLQEVPYTTAIHVQFPRPEQEAERLKKLSKIGDTFRDKSPQTKEIFTDILINV
jgi:hypothetical protein